MKRSSKITTYLLFFFLIAATLYLCVNETLINLALRLIDPVRPRDILIPAAIVVGLLLVTYIFYYAVCYRRRKLLPILVQASLLFVLSFEVLLIAVYDVLAPLSEKGLITLPHDPFFPAITLLPLSTAVFAYVVALLCIASVVRSIRKIQRTIYAAIAHKEYKPSSIRSGNELQALSREVNELTEAALGFDTATKRRSDAYLHFIPERFLTLVGCDDIEQITRSTTASREMAVMSVLYGLTFEQGSDAQSVFERINNITERVSRTVGDNGGTMFNYTYNGFAAVFPDTKSAVGASVAIQQEIYKTFTGSQVCIGIDYGIVLIGVVGDNVRLTPTIVSAALDNSRKLAETARLLNIGTLGSENAAELAEMYSSRYIGKCADALGAVRVYEFFDGTSYEVSSEIKRFLGEFSGGLLQFYSGNYSAAKRVFLNIVKEFPQDRVNRYYLYKTDKFEKEPPSGEFVIGGNE
ncbi:MAG: hypothetical protein LBN97_02680 [Oscillospiraceae bacterium]|nr:hypothetical protein [Oscillospiraceae bacterium]